MRKVILIFSFIFLSFYFVAAQSVDSIKTEQSGDYVKIRYKILNSNQNQLFRVRVLCSINGGLNTEIKSVSGDTGDNVVGGKSEYFVVWDVLKDVSELKSVEFIVRAELVKNLNTINIQRSKSGELTDIWSKKRFFIMAASEFPAEPKIGIRMGFMGSFGVSLQFVNGKVALNGQSASVGSNSYDPPKTASFSLDITKRIVNRNGFQMHLMAGIQKTEILSRNPNSTIIPYQMERVSGPEIGMSFGIKRFAFSILGTHFDPASFEKKDDRVAASPLNYISFCIGTRF
jgi:hypothetical protein